MRRSTALSLLSVGSLIVLTSGCVRPMDGLPADDAGIVAEGVLYSVEYQLDEGRTGGFTRLNKSGAVPGGNGSWNIDAYGRLTKDYLIITYPQRPDLGPRVIPARRLVDVYFGDGGIKEVDESKPAS